MKVELNSQEIEFLLVLINNAANDTLTFSKTPVFSIEELALIEKLETALKKEQLLEIDFNELNSKQIQH